MEHDLIREMETLHGVLTNNSYSEAIVQAGSEVKPRREGESELVLLATPLVKRLVSVYTVEFPQD